MRRPRRRTRRCRRSRSRNANRSRATGKRLGGPVGQRQQRDAAGRAARAAPRLYPSIGPDSVSREARRVGRDEARRGAGALGRASATASAHVPCPASMAWFHCAKPTSSRNGLDLLVGVQQLAVEVAGVPVDQHAAEVEHDRRRAARAVSGLMRSPAGRPARGRVRRPCARCGPRRPRAAPRRRSRLSCAGRGPGTAPGRTPRAPARAPRPTPGSVGRGEEPLERPGSPVTDDHPDRGREAQLGPLGQLAVGEGRRVPADQRLHGRVGGVGQHHDLAAVRAGRTSAAAAAQRRSASSPARRSGADEQRPAVEQQRRGVAALGHRLGARRGDHERRLGADAGQHRRAPPECGPACPGRPGRAPRPCAPSPTAVARSRVAAAGRAGPGRRGDAAPAAGRARAARRRAERSAARGAPGRRAAPGAGQAGDVAARAAPARAPGRRCERREAVRQARWAAGRRAAGVAGRRPVRPYAGASRRTTSRGRRHGVRPAGAQQGRALGGAGVAADDQGRALEAGAQGEHLADVRVGRARLGMQVVAVVPDHDQAQVGRPGRTWPPGCPPRRGTRRGARRASAGSARRARARRVSTTWWPVPSSGRQRRVDPAEVAVVGHHHEGAAAGGQRGADQVGDLGRPARAGQRRPHRPRRRHPAWTASSSAGPCR